MALSTAAKLGLMGATVITIVGVSEGFKYYEHQRKKKEADKKTSIAEGLAGVYDQDQVFGNSGLVPQIAFPIQLSFEAQVLDPETGNVVPFGSNVLESATPLAYVVTNLTPDMMKAAYEWMTYLVGAKSYDLSDPATRDKAVRETLMKWAPKIDWSEGLKPYTYGSVPFKVWTGVQTVGEIAAQSLRNKQMVMA